MKKDDNDIGPAFVRIKWSSVIAFLILVLFLFIDPPVTIIGWALSLGITVFLVYIVLQIYILSRNKK